jgi:hypothetical protein
MSKKLLNEIHRFQELAGINNEMRVGPDGSLMSDEEAVNKAFEGATNSLGKIINALHKNPSYTRAKDALNLWIKSVSEKLGISPESVPTNNLVFTGRYPALQAVPMIKQIFVDLISGNEDELAEEDDYDMGTPSGDTDAMNIAEDDFSATMDAVDKDPVT